VRVYLDHQAATPILPEVRVAMEPFLEQNFGNPSSLHNEGFVARDAIAKAREQLAAFVGASSPEEIIFTGNGTEAVNLAIKGTAWANERHGKHIVLSAAEHPAVTQSVNWLAQHGFECSVVPVDSEGRISPEAVRSAVRQETTLICIHHANHDVGTIQEVRQISEFTGERGITLFVDAIATAGWIPLDVEALQADLVAISPHRFYGPKGVGVLFRHRRARVQSVVHGGEQEGGRRAGTENVPSIVGAGMAAEIAGKELSNRARYSRLLQQRVLTKIRETVPFMKLNGPEPGPHRHPANLNLSIEFAEGEALGLMLDVKGIAVATGSACVAKNQRIPPVLAAIGLPESLARGNVILSFGKDNTEAEVDHFVEIFAKAVLALREMSPEWDDFQKGLVGSALSAGPRKLR
jgi:cysteine desulfurase